MEEEKHTLPDEVRLYIVHQAASGLKQKEIVDLVLKKFGLKTTQSCVSKIISKHNKEGTIEDRPRSGRPKKLSNSQELAIVAAVHEDRTLTANAVSKDPNLNPYGDSHVTSRTITTLLNDHGLKDSTDVVETISEEAMNQRLAFALHCKEKKMDWTKIIFSDESDLFPDKQGKVHYRRYESERVNLDLGPTPRWDPRKVKVWGTISHTKVGTLVRYTETVDGEKYTNFLKDHLWEDFPLLRGTKTRDGKLLFQHDNASPHRDSEAKKFLKDNHIGILTWPSYSPDLSPIENIWGYIKAELFKKNNELETADDTWEEVQKIWYGRVKFMLEKLYSSIPNRIEDVIELGGARIN